MRRVFSPVGGIVNVSMEPAKNCSFVTFEKSENAQQAIEEINGSLVGGIQLKVSLARHQPSVEPPHSAPPASETPQAVSSWSSMAANSSQKGSHRDKRELVTYQDQDEDIF